MSFSKNQPLRLAAGLALLASATGVAAQESTSAAELRFVRELRGRHYTDLALEYLESTFYNINVPIYT